MAGGVIDEYCCSCDYLQGAFENAWCCHYFLLTGIRRPCPAGKGCTVRKPAAVPKRFTYNHYPDLKEEKTTPVLRACKNCGALFIPGRRRLYCCGACQDEARIQQKVRRGRGADGKVVGDR